MATDLSTLAGPAATRRITMDASAGNAEQVTLPAWASAVLIKIRDSGGTDTTGAVIYVRANPGEANLRTVYLASDSAGGYAHVAILEAQ